MADAIVLKILNNLVSLDTGCWNCARTGRANEKNTYRMDDGSCEICKGKGFQLTDEGEAIIALVKRHL